jgi:multicomponent Na+:H+ antiporter subunit G
MTEALLLIGATFLLLAAIGVLRMPDVFMRMSASTKAVTLGNGCLLAGLALEFQDTAVTTRAVLIIAFFFLKSPVAAQMIGRAAYFTGTPLWEGTRIDELRGRYDLKTHTLASSDEQARERAAQGDEDGGEAVET